MVPEPEPPPETTPSSIELLDAQPADGVTQADPGIADVTLSHFGYTDFAIDVSGDCADGSTLVRSTEDLSVDFDALFEHSQVCDGLADNGSYQSLVRATRDDGDTFEVRLEFATAIASAPALQVQDSVTTPRESVADLFQTFLDESLIDDLNVPDSVAAVVQSLVQAVAESAYGELLDADPLFGVTAQRVIYASRRPDGSASSQLTGLVAYPDTTAADFQPRDSIIVLSHSTGVTPSDLDVTDAWYLVATLFASRGYLVIAPDNWGRGGTSSEPETFLMARQTAANSLDLVGAVLADPAYDAARGPAVPSATIVGYSQGGHTAVALWQAMAAQAPDIAVPGVYAGAGPYNLYATARGVVEHANGSCNDGVYCRYVTDGTTVPFLTERVLPGYIGYAADGLVLDNVLDGETLSEGFVAGFLRNEPAFDDLKGLLQQSSFTNVAAGLDLLTGAGTRFSLFHSAFDRLVPVANTEELVPVIEPYFEVDFRIDACNSDAYAAIFNATDYVGISHALCGLEMLNDVFGELR